MHFHIEAETVDHLAGEYLSPIRQPSMGVYGCYCRRTLGCMGQTKRPAMGQAR